MATFDEIPQVIFEAKDADGNVEYRDAIVYDTMAELRADSATERQAKFQARYEKWLEIVNTPPVEPIPEEG